MARFETQSWTFLFCTERGVAKEAEALWPAGAVESLLWFVWGPQSYFLLLKWSQSAMTGFFVMFSKCSGKCRGLQSLSDVRGILLSTQYNQKTVRHSLSEGIMPNKGEMGHKTIPFNFKVNSGKLVILGTFSH